MTVWPRAACKIARGGLVNVRRALTMSALLFAACEGEPSHWDVHDAGVQPIVFDPKHSTCMVDADCAWSDIDHEIHRLSECVCVFRCPLFPVSSETAMRRAAQRDGVCEPGLIGPQAHCDDKNCAPAPPIACIDGLCREAEEPSEPAAP